MTIDAVSLRKMKLKPIIAIARGLGIAKKHLRLYGDYKAKISLDVLKGAKPKKQGRYILVTGITPTHFGEGKTVTTIGLSMALNRLGKRSVSTIRQPSLGPLFGIKGGGVGGGRSRALPAADINIHFTGDIHAVTAAHDLAASFLDNHLFRGNDLSMDPDKIFWHRVLDVNDRALRNIRVGIAGGENGFERDTRFDITAASEIMAILALSGSVSDMRKRLSRITVGLTKDGKGVTCEDLKVAGAMSALLVDAIEPNLVQTPENTPCLIHTGPFANITHGNSSILADRIGLKFSDYVVTESGFGADCGAEKFVNIKCRASGLRPNAAVLVCSIRALKAHSGSFKVIPGKPLDKEIYSKNMDALARGSTNLIKQIENVKVYGIPCVVAINRFATDTEDEIEFVKKTALECGAFDCVTSEIYKRGSVGGVDLARAVIKACEIKSAFKFLYGTDIPIKEKIERIATKIYGAKGVIFELRAEENIALYEKLGLGGLPICMAKTHLSLSHDPSLKGAPKDFMLPVRDVRPSTGAGFLYALCGKMLSMPGLPAHPNGERIDIDRSGRITGLEL
ncbi:MAG: formate--tetrahydrofolate ligase [Candidatus Omnitrophota bacterium]|jgi:formate--tetrahydrofolate ligase